jgi:signal transduction histidine kinase
MADELTTARILIVDDQVANVRVLERLLQQHGYTDLTSTMDAREVLRLCTRLQPDLILLDLQMPHLDGFQVLDQLSAARGPTEYLPVLVLTADSSPAAKQQALGLGATDFLAKPLDAVEVLLRIRNLLETRRLHRALQDHNRLLEARVLERTHDLVEAREAALAASRLKTEFLATMSHELRTPLAGILGMTELLLDTPLSAEQQEFTDGVLQSAQRLQALVSDLLDFAALEAGHITLQHDDILLPELLEQTIATFQAEAEAKHLVLRGSVAAEVLPQLQGDRRHLARILGNLVSNAVKFTVRGTVEVEVGRRRPRRRSSSCALACAIPASAFQRWQARDCFNHLPRRMAPIRGSMAVSGWGW